MIKAKEYLRRIRLANAKIDADIENIATLEALATKITPTLGGERVQSSGNQQRMEDVVCKIVDKQTKVSAEIDRLVDMQDEARRLIQAYCDHDCITLLTKKYVGVRNPVTERIEYLTWEQIAVDMCMSYKWVSGGLHQRALSQLQVGIDENKICDFS